MKFRPNSRYYKNTVQTAKAMLDLVRLSSFCSALPSRHVTTIAIDARGVAHGSIYLAAHNLLSTFVGVLGYSFLTRSISQVDVGAVAGLTLLASLLQLLSDLGLSPSLAKFVSELKGRGESASGYFTSALLIRLPLAALL